jgi:hypothetical protein
MADRIEVPHETPLAPRLEQWDPGVPDKLIAATDPAWKWTGEWRDEVRGPKNEVVGRSSETAGATGEMTFSGTGVALVGAHGRDGGRADVFIDGRKTATVDAWIPERTSDNDLWHTEGLSPGTHTLRIVLTGAADTRSQGQRVVINRVIGYRASAAAR